MSLSLIKRKAVEVVKRTWHVAPRVTISDDWLLDQVSFCCTFSQTFTQNQTLKLKFFLSVIGKEDI